MTAIYADAWNIGRLLHEAARQMDTSTDMLKVAGDDGVRGRGDTREAAVRDFLYA